MLLKTFSTRGIRKEPLHVNQGQESNVGARGSPATGDTLCQARRMVSLHVGKELVHFLLWASLRNEVL